jgi:hypothetical protein
MDKSFFHHYFDEDCNFVKKAEAEAGDLGGER